MLKKVIKHIRDFLHVKGAITNSEKVKNPANLKQLACRDCVHDRFHGEYPLTGGPRNCGYAVACGPERSLFKKEKTDGF